MEQTFYPKSIKEWRLWLKKNHVKLNSIWLIYYKKSSNIASIEWSEAVDEALCFGWIDSTRKSIDEERFVQLFTKRKATSTWSKINKLKVEKLIEKGLMTDAGLKCIEIAKQNGSWEILDDVENLIIPDDLEKEFKLYLGSKDFFMTINKSTKKSILQWIALAKKPETRKKRIVEIVEAASQKLKPKQFR